MLELLLVGVVAGFLAGISPCILPVLPVILVGGAGPAPARAGGLDASGSAKPPVQTGASVITGGAKTGAGTSDGPLVTAPKLHSWHRLSTRGRSATLER